MRPPLPLLAATALLALAACQPDASPELDADPEVPAELPTFSGDLALVDDGARDPGFSAFRDTLRAVVARRDTAALLALVAPDARLSFGDTPGGPEGVRAMWLDGEPPTGEPIWDVLDHVLDGGSVAEDGAVSVPFVAGLWPEDLDPFEHVAVPGRDVPALDAPGGEPAVRLTEVALPVDGPPEDGWWHVTLPDGRTAIVAVEDAYSPVGYRATFWDDGDGWRLRSFLAGD